MEKGKFNIIWASDNDLLTSKIEQIEFLYKKIRIFLLKVTFFIMHYYKFITFMYEIVCDILRGSYSLGRYNLFK